MFEYGETEIGNKSIDFEHNQLKNSSIKTSASKKKTLMHNLIIILYLEIWFLLAMKYPQIIRSCGPPKYSWNFRSEAKHRESKIYSRNVMCNYVKAALKFTTFLDENANGLPHNFELKKNLS